MSITDLINQQGSKSFKFDLPGATITGKVVSAEAKQATNFDTGQPEFWDNGDPKMLIRFVLQTSLIE